LTGKASTEQAAELVSLIESVPGVVSVEDVMIVPQRT
jgi:hypothetical protein